MKNTIKILIIAAMSVLLLESCTSRKFVRGYVADAKMVAAIRPEVDTRNSVRKMLGSPSATATFDNNSWYYYSKKSESLAFFKEDITALNIIAVHFDNDGYVTGIKRYTLADHHNIVPVGKRTKTFGRELSFIQELFSNIGQFGAAGPSTVQPGN
ncbi:MAG: outer membrane protein assembly factor BamE [Alphaproteobacteria bacterium]|nr:outer membrane protein assembly factor BamE [Alphaproteobacteria bacterium]